MSIGDIKIKDNGEELVDISKYGILFEPVYFKMKLSGSQKGLLRKGVIDKILLAREELPKDYNFKVWDGYRPRTVQKKLWDKYEKDFRKENLDWSDEKIFKIVSQFVADPEDIKRIPNHATGGAVDLTIINNFGKELDMGTGFDELIPRAASDYYKQKKKCSLREKKIAENRELLKVLANVGFVQYKYEWWHFDYGNQSWADAKKKKFAIYGEI